jgi:Tol biopolymer transport system component
MHATWMLMTAVIAFVGCDQLPTQSEPSADGVFAKGGGKGKPGGGGDDGDSGPVDPAILFTNPIGGKLGYTLFLMDETGAMKQALPDSEENRIHNTDPRWSPDGSRFLVKRTFYEGKSGWTEPAIWIANADGTGLGLVLSDVVGSARWLGSDRIVFVDDNADLMVTDLNGTLVDRLTTSGDIQGMVASPDGSQVLAQVGDELDLRLYTVTCSPCAVEAAADIDGARSGLSGQWLTVEDWAHGSDRVLLTVRVGWGNSDVGVLDLSGPAAVFTDLVVSPVDEYNAAWSDDDQMIVFARYPSDQSSRSAGIVLRDVASGVEQEVTTSVGPVGIDWRR